MSDNSLKKLLIEPDGRKAFYDGVLRYKNPCTDEEAAKFWFQGWDASCKEHRLFTTNQELIIRNQELSSQVEELILQAAQSDNEKIKALREDIRSIIVSIKTGNFITFSREKIRLALKKLVSRG